MSNSFGALVTAGIAGSLVWALGQYRREEDHEEVQYIVVPAATGVSKSDRNRNALLGIVNLFASDDFTGALSGIATSVGVPPAIQQAVGVTPSQPVNVGATASGMAGLLALLRRVESGGDYNIVWGGIAKKDRPPRPLTTMTVNEVLAWQDSIDPRYRSEAAGAYQFLEDTLRLLVRLGLVNGNAKFNVPTQDAAAVARMRQQRGLDRYLAGKMSAEDFGQEIAKEWASMPAITRDRRGRPATGQSYYAGDGLNKSLVTRAELMSAVRGLK